MTLNQDHLVIDKDGQKHLKIYPWVKDSVLGMGLYVYSDNAKNLNNTFLKNLFLGGGGVKLEYFLETILSEKLENWKLSKKGPFNYGAPN